MSTIEFEAGARGWRELLDLDRTAAISAACRGSGNPAVLAWLAEGLELDDTSRILDVGGGLGGPCAWLELHYQCTTVNVDPVVDGARCARTVFDVASAISDGGALPFRDRSFDAALLLGVLSVVEDPVAVLREVARVSDRLGLIVYCSTGPDPVECGGSRFFPGEQLADRLAAGGWRLDAEPVRPTLPPPPPWSEPTEGEAPSSADERAVARALAEGCIEPLTAIATRAGSAIQV